jgi:hypothetical protein
MTYGNIADNDTLLVDDFLPSHPPCPQRWTRAPMDRVQGRREGADGLCEVLHGQGQPLCPYCSDGAHGSGL